MVFLKIVYIRKRRNMPVYCLVDIWSNDEGYLFICKADERGDAVASLSESNEVIWKNRQVVCLIINETVH